MGTKVDLVIDQGSTFNTTINLLDNNGDALDLTGYTGISHIKKTYTSTTNTAFSVSISNGSVTLALTASQSAKLIAGRYVYDVKLSDISNNVSRIAEGIVTVTPSV